MNRDKRYDNLYELEKYGHVNNTDRIVCPHCGSEYPTYTSDELLALDKEGTVELTYKCVDCVNEFKFRVTLEYTPSYLITTYKQGEH